MSDLTTHGACGRTWHQSGNRTSHCSGCHHTFASLTLFDAHRRDGACRSPLALIDHGTPLRVETRGQSDGVWYSPGARAAARARFATEDQP